MSDAIPSRIEAIIEAMTQCELVSYIEIEEGLACAPPADVARYLVHLTRKTSDLKRELRQTQDAAMVINARFTDTLATLANAVEMVASTAKTVTDEQQAGLLALEEHTEEHSLLQSRRTERLENRLNQLEELWTRERAARRSLEVHFLSYLEHTDDPSLPAPEERPFADDPRFVVPTEVNHAIPAPPTSEEVRALMSAPLLVDPCPPSGEYSAADLRAALATADFGAAAPVVTL